MSSTKAAGVGVCIAMPLLALLAVCLRFYVRRHKRASIGTDDYTILVSLVCSTLDPTLNPFGSWAWVDT